MKISIQNYVMNKNINYTAIKSYKINFKGKILTSDAFAKEEKIIENIRTMPENIFKEKAEFLRFCKSINITPNISRAIKKRLTESRQPKTDSDKTLNSLIKSSERIIEGYKWLLNDGRKLLTNEIAQVKEIMSDSKLPQDIRTKAKELLERIHK